MKTLGLTLAAAFLLAACSRASPTTVAGSSISSSESAPVAAPVAPSAPASFPPNPSSRLPEPHYSDPCPGEKCLIPPPAR